MSVLGMIEFSSIAVGIIASDAMVKAAPVDMLESHPIDPGKYLAAVTGDVASVEASVAAGLARAGAKQVVYSFVIANLHDQVLPTLRKTARKPAIDAIGVIETQSAASVVVAADAACKCAAVSLLTLHLALRIGGKGYTVFSGDIADVEASVDAGGRAAGADCLEQVIIPNPYGEMVEHLLNPDHFWKGG